MESFSKYRQLTPLRLEKNNHFYISPKRNLNAQSEQSRSAISLKYKIKEVLQRRSLKNPNLVALSSSYTPKFNKSLMQKFEKYTQNFKLPVLSPRKTNESPLLTNRSQIMYENSKTEIDVNNASLSPSRHKSTKIRYLEGIRKILMHKDLSHTIIKESNQKRVTIKKGINESIQTEDFMIPIEKVISEPRIKIVSKLHLEKLIQPLSPVKIYQRLRYAQLDDISGPLSDRYFTNRSSID